MSFDKLLESKRMKIYANIQDYLASKKTMNGIIPNEYSRELFITSHETLRMGEASYLFQNLNMQK